MKRLILLFVIMISFGILNLNAWDDEILLSSTSADVKPNIMILMDNSGSMNTLIFHPDYDPNHYYTNPSDGIWYGENYKVEYYRRGTYYDYHTGRYKSFDAGYYLGKMWDNTYSHLYKCEPVAGVDDVVKLDVKNYPYTNAHPDAADTVYLYIDEDKGNLVRIPGNFLNFLVYDATPEQLATWNHFEKYGNWDAGSPPSIDGGDTTDPDTKILDYGGDLYYTANDKKIRIRVARMALTQILHDIYESEEGGKPRIGFTIFENDSDPDGGTIQQMCQDNSDFVSMANNIKEIEANTWTPLSETYAEIWAYFRHGGEAHITQSMYFLPLSDPSAAPLNRNGAITNWCQLNFVIIVTDGEPTKDNYLRTLTYYNSNIIFNTNKMGDWGDPPSSDNDNDYETLASDGTNYLDDLAYYAYNNDLFPDDINVVKNDSDFDLIYKNKQFIYTYTIGFTINNQLLRDTAEHGGGEYFTANNYTQLVQSLRNVFASIDEKVNAYAAFAAPKYSTLTHGHRGYIATFIPRNTKNLWEGHLKCYLLDYEGNFPEDLDNPGKVQVYDDDGNLVEVDSYQWDAGDVLNNRTEPRVVYTAKSGALVSFDNTNITPADLDINTGDTTQDEQYRDELIDFILGDNGYDWKLGDIFHFNPVVVGAPLKWKGAFDPSYKDFYEYYTKTGEHDTDGKLRKEVIYVGANDGMLHCFNVENGDELWAFIPPSLLPNLKHMDGDIPNSNNEHTYFVDGKAVAIDIKVDNNGDYTDWKTILVFGLGIGGTHYYAIDITDPEDPKFLWEFTDSTYMGLTEGKPVIATVNLEGELTPVVFLPGGYDRENNEADSSHSETLIGKAFYIIKAETGELVKKFVYGASTSDPDTKVDSYYVHTNNEFTWAFTATPTVLDYNYDGIADYVYMFMTGDYTGSSGNGGEIWKINLNGEISGWRPTKIFKANDGQTFYLPATLGYDSNYKLWILIGSGHRAVPNDDDNIAGKFYGIVDNGNISSPLDESDLQDISDIVYNNDTGSLDLSVYRGFYFNFNDDKEIIFEPYPIYMNTYVYFNTYAPDVAGTVVDPCNPEGNQQVYSLKVDSGEEEMEAEVETGKIQGYGSLDSTNFKIYIGLGEVGSYKLKDQKTIDLSSIFGPIFWIEHKL